MSTAGRKLLSSIVADGTVSTFLKLGVQEHVFKEGELLLYNLIVNHLSKYGKIPKPTTVEEALPDSLVDAPEPPKFYLDEVHARYLHNTLKAGTQEIMSLLNEKHAPEALEVFTKVVVDFYKKKARTHVTSFRDAQEIVYKTYLSQKSSAGSIALPYGWPTLDEMSGGMRAGDFNTMVGRPMMGKTMMLLFTALHAWKIGRKPLFISLEMDATIIHQRLAAMFAKVKLTDLLKAELSTKAFNAMMEKLGDLKNMAQDLWIVDGTEVKTPDDVVLQCQILQPDSLWVDAMYLLEMEGRMGKFEKQGEVAKQVKQRVAMDMEMPVTASYQLSKESAKSKKKNKDFEAGMEDVYGSDYMAQLSSVMLGLFDTETDVEKLKRRTIRLLKGRSGEVGSFDINWDFGPAMNFSEIPKPKTAEEEKELELEFMG